MEDITLPRLVYLLGQFRLSIPPRLSRYLPGPWLKVLGDDGFLVASRELGLPTAYLQKLAAEGEKLGPGTESELRKLLAEGVLSGIQDLPLVERLGLMKELSAFVEGEQILTPEIYTLDKPPADLQGIPKWDSGCVPFDVALGGMYQGILMIMGKPGVGKTSLMLTLMADIVAAGEASSVLFVENEIPGRMLMGRARPIFDRMTFREQDVLVAASWGPQDIISWIADNPDPGRVVFFDSPDVVTGGGGDKRRFDLEKAYQDLITIKQQSKLVVVSSHSRRNDRALSIESVAEAWLKAYYSDMIVGLQAVGEVPGGGTNIKIVVLKNRFGPKDNSVTFAYNYDTLSWEVQGIVASDEIW